MHGVVRVYENQYITNAKNVIIVNAGQPIRRHSSKECSQMLTIRHRCISRSKKQLVLTWLWDTWPLNGSNNAMSTKLLITFGFFLLVKANTASPLPPAKTSIPTSQEKEHVEDHCLKYDYQIHDALTSTKPPFDNYFNISRAIYPSEDISSKLINIWVHFTNSSDNLTQVGERKFIWSRSCLYVSDRYLSLRAMNLYSLGSIWPDRRQEDLHITIFTFCHPQATMTKLVAFLSTVSITKWLVRDVIIGLKIQ